MKLCVSCKGCRRECPTGVDMARMKIEVQAARAEKYGLSLHDRLVGYLPRYARYAAKVPWLMNLRDALPGRGENVGSDGRVQRAAQPAEMARRRVSRSARPGGGKQRGRAVRRHLQPLLRAREPRRRARRADGRRLSRARREARRRLRRVRCAAAARSWRSARSIEARKEAERTLAALAPFVVARRSGRRPGAELPAQLPRRGAGDGEGRARQAARRPRADLRGVSGPRSQGRPAAICR